MSGVDELAGQPIGRRIRHFRQRAGMSRPVLGELVGRSGEWVKAVETGRLLTPRLPLLIRLAEVLHIDDLALLTGKQKLASASYMNAAHKALPHVAQALATYPILTTDTTPVGADILAERVTQVWDLWHGAKRHRTAIAGLLPPLLADAQVSTRLLDGVERRSALRSLAQTYHLAQLYLSFQPVPELIRLTGDRAFIAAQDADDPHAMAVAAWYLNHVFRDAGQQLEARVQLAKDTTKLLKPERRTEDLALWGLLQLAAALSFAKVGQEGSAWHYWDKAHKAAGSLGAGYTHKYMIFGMGMVEAYAVTMLTDLMRPREAIRRAERLVLDQMPSATRRSFHYAETARAYHQNREPVATVHLLSKAHAESSDTLQFSLFARSALTELSEHGGSSIRHEAHELAHKLGLVA